ncbi:hypothetical protein [Spongiactinospora sp. 9N601]|uniref:hypothetical protein n=1 Tax=Spongiactinospora sp. 9N601 TaxID=3375149 RepID=UPI0037A6384B
MAADSSVPTPQWLAQQLQTDDPDMLRSMVKTMAEALMSAEADGERWDRGVPSIVVKAWRTSRVGAAGVHLMSSPVGAKFRAGLGW